MPNSQQTPKENDIPENYRPLKGSERRPRRGAVRVRPADPSETVLISIYVRPRLGAPPLPNQDYYATTPVGQRERQSRTELAVVADGADARVIALKSLARSEPAWAT